MEVSMQLANKEVMATLVTTTFKGLATAQIKQAIVEGMIRGFTFKDFLDKNIYAVPFGNTYGLVTSLDYARKIGQKMGVVGKSAPIYEEKDGKVVSCTITIKKKVAEVIGEFTASVYLEEYSTGKNLWLTKPRTMLAKVAEVHALRMACPEELSKAYVAEEMETPTREVIVPPVDLTASRAILEATKTNEELKKAWLALPPEARANEELVVLKNELKIKLTPVVAQTQNEDSKATK